MTVNIVSLNRRFFSLLFTSLTLTSLFFFFNDTATTEIYTLSLHDALPILSGPPQPSLCLGVVRGPRCADQMRPWWPMPVTIIPLEAAGVLGLLVCHPPGRLVAGAAGHPIVEGAARVAPGECSDVAPPPSPLRRPRQLRLRHVAVDPHHVVAAHDRIHGIRLARERFPLPARPLPRRGVIPTSPPPPQALDHSPPPPPPRGLARLGRKDPRPGGGRRA